MTAESAGPFIAALLAGVTYGTAYCGPSCGPFLCTYIMGANPGGFQAMKSMAVFTAARVATCGMVGAVSATVGTTLFPAWGGSSAVLGVVVMAVGATMWRRPAAKADSQTPIRVGEPIGICNGGCLRRRSAMPLWLAGAAFALTPCPPMLAMLACSANAGSPGAVAAVMMLFGLGTAISPVILVALLAGHFSARIRSLAPQHALLFHRTASLTLLFLGCLMLFQQ